MISEIRAYDSSVEIRVYLLKLGFLISGSIHFLRLENTTPVTYSERDNVKGKKSKGERLLIFEGPRVEVYTEEHEKLLGNTERSWTCFVDGYGKDGKRIYDPFKGKTCHQCRFTLRFNSQDSYSIKWIKLLVFPFLL